MTIGRDAARALSRRGFLIGAGGATLALPFLESLAPRQARAGVPPRPVCAAFVRSGNGVAQELNDEPERFWPRGTGPLDAGTLAGRDADRAVSELAAYASRMSLLRGVNLPFDEQDVGHTGTVPQCLTAHRNTGGDSNEPLALGPSVDWRLARAMGGPNAEPLVLMAGPSDAYIREATSWRGPRDRAPAERSPANVWMRMMRLTSAPPEIQADVGALRRSVNDLVREQMTVLLGRPELGRLDRQRLERHFAAVRDMEQRMMPRACGLAPATIAAIGAVRDPEANDARVEVVRQHLDLVAFAFSCGLARAASLQIGDGNDTTEYEIDGERLPSFHWVSHRIMDDDSDGPAIAQADEKHHKIDRLQLQMFRHLLESLESYTTSTGGTLLDDGIAAWTNDLATGPPHGIENVPWILVGSAAGELRTGQFLDLGGVTNNVVLNTILTAAGVRGPNGEPTTDCGDPSLPRDLVPELLAG